MKVYFATHATTTDNENNISSGWKDAELSELGVKQAKELKNHLKNLDFDFICCSDQTRAVDTVNLAFSGKYPVIVDQRLRELNYGNYNGQPKTEVEKLKFQYLTKPFPNGESYQQAEKRVHDFFNEAKTKYLDKTLLVVGSIATRHGLETLTGKATPQQLLEEKFVWQPYWKYEI